MLAKKISNKSYYKYIILIILSLIQATGNWSQYMMSPNATKIIDTLGLTAQQYSSAFAAPLAPAIFLSLIAGIIVDRIGFKKPIGLALFCGLIGQFLRIFATGYGMLYASLFLIGVSCTVNTVNCSKVLSNFFPKEKVGTMLGIFFAIIAAGQTLGLATGAAFPSLKMEYTLAAVITFIALLLWIFVVVEPKQKVQADHPSVPAGIKAALSTRKVWTIAIGMAFAASASTILSSILPSALTDRGISAVTAGLVSSFFTIGSFAGNLTVPRLAAKFGIQRKYFLAVISLFFALGLAFAWKAPAQMIFLCMIATGFCFGGMNPSLTSLPIQMQEIGPKYAGTAGGTITTIQILGPVLFVPYVVTVIANGVYARYFTIAAILAIGLMICHLLLPKDIVHGK